MRKLDSVLHDRLKSLITSMGYDYVGAEMQQQGQTTVFRIFIDSLPESEKTGVTADDCSLVSRQVSAMLDVEDFMQGRYILELSSPGLDRPLYEIEHFVKFVGSNISLRLHMPLDGRRQFKGLLERVDGEDIYLLVDGIEQAFKLPYHTIEKANLIASISF